MGAIQQAFNQGLASLAIATGPIHQQQKAQKAHEAEIKAAQAAHQAKINEAHTGAEAASAARQELVDAKYFNEEAFDIATRKEIAAYQHLYKMDPQASTLEHLGNLKYEQKQASRMNTAEVAAQSVKTTRAQYADQQENMRKFRYTIKRPGGAE